MYSNNYTCKYVYANTASSPPFGALNYIIVKLPPESVRSPNMKIQLVSSKFISDTEYPGIIVRMDQSSDSFYSADFKGCILGFADVAYARNNGDFFHYVTDNAPPPEYVVSSHLQEIKLTFSQTGGTELLPGVLSQYAFVFKLSYPVQNEIQNQFRDQVNPGF